MKNLIVLFVVTLISFGTYAQNSIFDKFEEMDEVSSVIVNKEAFRMLAKFKGGGEEGQEGSHHWRGSRGAGVCRCADSQWRESGGVRSLP